MQGNASLGSRWNWVTYCGVVGTLAALSVMLYAVIRPATSIFPMADEWVYVKPMTSHSLTTFLEFVIGPHGDHRVPLQKLVQAALLRISGFDFRWLTGFNAVLAAVVSIVLLTIARICRGYSSIGDLMIPAIAVNFCTPFTASGFDMQILTGTLFMSLFTYALIVLRSDSLATAMLLLCAWCGLNGAAMALVVCVAMAWWLYKHSVPFTSLPWTLAALTVLSCIVQVVLWRLGAHPHSYPVGLHVFLSFLTGSMTSNMFAWAADGRAWKFVILTMLLAGGFAVLVRQVNREGATIKVVAFGGPMVASLFMVMVAAMGRSNRPWTQDYDIHYGYMAILLPIYAWILMSSELRLRSRAMIGIFLCALYAMSFAVNYQTRMATVSTSSYYYRLAQQAIASTKPPAAVADEFIGIFSYAVWTNKEAREFTADGIARLRKFGGRAYRPESSE